MNDVREWLVDTLGEPWTYALVGGLLSVALILRVHSAGATHIDMTPIFVVAVVAGYLYSDGSRRVNTVGTRIGLLGSLAVLWLSRGFFLGLGSQILTAETLWYGLGGPLFLGLTLGLLVGLAVLAGWLGAALGGWLATKSGRTRGQPTA